MEGLAALSNPFPRQIPEVETAHRSRAAGKLSEETSGAALKRLLYLTSRADSKAFGQAAANALLFGVRHAVRVQMPIRCACPLVACMHRSPSRQPALLARRA